MSLTVVGCCAEDIQSLGMDCALETASPRNLSFIPRTFNGVRNYIDLEPSSGTIGSNILEMSQHISTTYSKMWVLPEPTQVTFVKSEATTATDPVGYENRTEGGEIYMVTISYVGDGATRLLERGIDKFFKCSELDMFYTDDNGALAGLRKPNDYTKLYGYQVVNSTYRTMFAPAVKGTSPNTLTVMFQIRRVNIQQYIASLLTAVTLGYDANDLVPLKCYTGILETISSTSLQVILRAEGAKANSGLYLMGASTMGTWTLVNNTASTTTTILSASITEVPVDPSLIVVGTNEPRYTVTITAQTAGDDIAIEVSGIAGYEVIKSNVVDAL